MLEPIIIPKLLIHFADFPYAGFVVHRAPNPLVLMRFGTSARQLFARGASAVRLGTVLDTAPPQQVATARRTPSLRCRHMAGGRRLCAPATFRSLE